LIRRVGAYVAYRIGEGPEAEDVTSDVFERALRYRDSYEPSRGEPIAWLIGIARRCIEDTLRARQTLMSEPLEVADPTDLEDETVRRLALGRQLSHLDVGDQELIALRYGADLTARQIGELIGMRRNAVEVALHRALARLRAQLEGEQERGETKRLGFVGDEPV
ncbi:MAG: sigma-70 family RNA polymerase sigma factor, partial [Thermoleophilia bacterium]